MIFTVLPCNNIPEVQNANRIPSEAVWPAVQRLDTPVMRGSE